MSKNPAKRPNDSDAAEPEATLPGHDSLGQDAQPSASGADLPMIDNEAEATLPGGEVPSSQDIPPDLTEPEATLPGTPESTPSSGRDSSEEYAEPEATVNLHEAPSDESPLPEATLAGDGEMPPEGNFEATMVGGTEPPADDFEATMVGGIEPPSDDFEATMMGPGVDDEAVEDDQAMATFVAPVGGVGAPTASEQNIPGGTENLTYIPDFSDENDELMKTQQADPALIDKLARGDGTLEGTVETSSKTHNPTKAPTERSVGGSLAASWMGKSAWDLRIHRRDVFGELTGVPNDIPRTMDEADGLATALVDDHAVSEFEIVDELGAGNMGVVYRATQTSLNRELAIKTLKPRPQKKGSTKVGTQQQQYEQEMFVSEAVVTANLVHPNIVPIHDLGRNAEGKLFYAMKCVTGTPWNKIIRKPGGLEEKLDILMKVCDAVAYAHSRGVINRDLKPENVVVGEYGEVMVLDWGLAVTTERFEKKGSVLTDIRGGAGTPVYMPPELFDRDVRRIGYHSDIYLLGAMLFEVLEGFPPHYLRKLWKQESGTGKFNAIVMAVINNEIETDVTDCELMNIALKAMSTKPDDRYATVEDFQNAIREYRISGRAEELLQKIETEQPSDYSDHQAAVALFEEARTKWPENERAVDGERRARLAYASLAVSKSDLDLASQVVDRQDGPEFDTIRQQVRSARRRQTMAKTALIAFMIATLGFGGYSYLAKQELIAKDQRLARVDEEIEAANLKKEQADRDAAAALAEVEKATQRVALAQAEAEKAEQAAAVAQQNAKLALQEADKAKADAMVAEAAAEKATREAAVAQKEATMALAEAEQAKKETKQAEAETVAAKADADKAAQEAKVAQAAAEKAKTELTVAQKSVIAATKQAKVAQAEATEAKAEATRVRKEAEVAVAKLETESEMLNKQIAVAKVEQQELQEEVYRSEYRVHKRFIDAFTELGEYGNAVRQIDKALSETDNVEIQKRADHLRRWKAELERRTGSSEVALGEPIERSGVSADGQSIALLSEDSDGQLQLTVVRDGVQASVPQPSRDLESFTFSRAGDILVGVGGATMQLWRKNAGEWTQAAIQKAATVQPVSALKAIFANDDRTLLVIGEDRSATIDAYVVDQQDVRFSDRLSLAGGVDADYSLRDAVIDPDSQFLIASIKRQSVRSYPITWNDDRPQLEVTGPNAAPVRLPVRPEQLVISSDGKYLALSSGRDVIVLPKGESADPRDFPFVSAKNPLATQIQTRIAVADLAFSADASRLIAGLDEKFIQVWNRDGSTFRPTSVEGLYKGQYLAGHSGGLRQVAFVEQSSDTVVSVGSDNALRYWSLDAYADYVGHFRKLPDLLDDPRTSQAPATDRRRAAIKAPKGANTIPVGFIETSTVTNTQASPASREIRFRQGREAFAGRLSNDGQRVIVAADDRAAHVYVTATGASTLEGSSTGRLSLFFDPARNAFLEGHIPQLSAVKFLPPNGDLLLTEDYFGSISVWDARSDDNGVGYEISRLLSEYSLSEFSVSRDGQYVIAGGAEIVTDDDANASLRHFGLVWSLDDIISTPTPKPYRRLDGEHSQAPITAVALSPSNRFAATAGRRGRIVLWDQTTNEVIARAASSHGKDQVSGIEFLDDRTLLTTGYDGKVNRWTRDGSKLTPIPLEREVDGGKATFVMRLRLADGKRWLTSEIISRQVPGGEPGEREQILEIVAWENEDPRVIYSTPIPDQDAAKPFRHDVAWSNDGSQAMVVLDGRVTIFDANDWSITQTLADPSGRSIRAAFSPADGREIALFDGAVTHLWNLDASSQIAEFRAHASVFAADFSSDRNYVATASDSVRIFIADESSDQHGKTVARLRTTPASPIRDVVFRPGSDSHHLATASRHGHISIWQWDPNGSALETPTQTLATPLAAEDRLSEALQVRWSPDGCWLAAVHFGQPRLWNVSGNEPIETNLNHAAQQFAANTVTWSTDGSRLAFGGFGQRQGDDNTDSLGFLWGIHGKQPELLGQLQGQHEVDDSTARQGASGVTAIAIDTLGDILTGGDRGEIVRWGVFEASPDSTEIESFGQLTLGNGDRPHDGYVTGIDVGSDGAVVSTGSNGWVVIRP